MERTKKGKERCESLQFCLHNWLLCMAAYITGQRGGEIGGRTGGGKGGGGEEAKVDAVLDNVFATPVSSGWWDMKATYVCMSV